MNKLVAIAVLVAGLIGVSAKTHHFTPSRYYHEFSAYMEPALHINPGDVVVTTCADSDGHDKNLKKVTDPPNPLTGPFYVEGTEPGDTLVVYLEKIRLNRQTGIQSTGMADNTVLPRYHRQNKTSPRIITWHFDMDTMTASVNDLSSRMSKFRLPLKPFLGCIGVAPAMKEAQSTFTADAHGGNMDYNQLVEGTTMYFPVSVAGAYFFVGDGHATQGDGETSGGGIETSMDVQFRVSVQKNKRIPSARAETGEYYLAMGMARPLDEAFQRATTNMIAWLTSDFGLSNEEAHVLLGSTARYDIGNIVDPRYTVACKIEKRVLHQVAKPLTMNPN
jgi:acetamidase/formamidase